VLAYVFTDFLVGASVFGGFCEGFVMKFWFLRLGDVMWM
jgi:hypothetical protein